jgi:PA14 domain/Ca-dependent carbohydrate-binding module xylan-binding/Glycosyl hydrolase family 26
MAEGRNTPRVMWVGWATMFLVGLTVVLALMLGGASLVTRVALALDTTHQAETMILPGGAIVRSDTSASGGKAVELGVNGAVTKSFSGSVSSVVVRAKGDQCSGAPQMRVSIDGSVIGTSSISNAAWSTFTYSSVDIPSGSHTLKIAYINNYRTTWCDRDLHVDYFVLTDAPSAPVNCPSGEFLATYRNEVKGFTTSPVMSRCEDASSDHEWGSGSPGAGVNPDNFTSSYVGKFDFAEAGDYKFDVTTNDGVRVYVDGVLLIEKWYDHRGSHSATKTLSAGEHEIRVEHYEGLYNAKLSVSWTKLAAAPPSPIAEPRVQGAYVSGAPWTAAEIDNFAALTGTKPSVLNWFESWSDTGFSRANYDAAYSRGITPLMTWQPWNHRYGANQPDYQLADITNGNHDAYIRAFAQNARDYGKPIYLRPMQEMNSDWFPWGVCANGNAPGDFVPAYRHIVDIFRAEGATNVKFVWTPNIQTACSDYQTLYPGDAYVDWVGLDGYNWGTAHSWSLWQSPAQVFAASYDELVAVAPNKPAMIAETASVEYGGDKAVWMRSLYLDTVPNRMPNVRAVLWYHDNLSSTVDLRVNTSAASLDAYRTVADSPDWE